MDNPLNRCVLNPFAWTVGYLVVNDLYKAAADRPLAKRLG